MFKNIVFGVVLLLGLVVVQPVFATCPVRHTCGQRPGPAPRAHSGLDSQAEIKAHNRTVMNFNAEQRRWTGCIQDYVRACRLEAERAQSEANTFIERLNSAVDENNAAR